MKKWCIGIIAAMMIMVSACVGSETSSEVKTDSTKVDTIQVDSAKVAIDTACNK